ncbi:MAG: TrkA family potassium uptake protein [Sandaracinaceae bacterium]|nr:TrkA family potassium uptake protein [Sandaracinaceae bacterium]
MRRQAIVVGLGQFGMALATSLAEKGVEVLAIDNDEDHVRAAAPIVAEAMCMDATDESALARTNPGQRDVCVCAIGNEAREASIISTALLKQLGAKRLVSRATDPLHARILRLVGAHEVVNPEQAFGQRFATRLIYSDVVDEIVLGPDLVLTELRPPDSFVGRSLADLQLPRRFDVTVVAVRRPDQDAIDLPSPSRPLEAGDLLVLVSRPGAVAKLLEKIS